MNLENLAFLHNRLKFLGFGESSPLNEELEQQVNKQLANFELYTEAFFDNGDTKLDAKLYFHRHEHSDRYYFNKYDALLRYKDDETQDRGQTIYLHNGVHGFTLKETFNLLQGRYVNKDLFSLNGEKYNSWVNLNFDEKDLHDNYRIKHFRSESYNLEKILSHYPIQELQTEDTKAALIKSLCKGNVQLVTFVFHEHDGRQTKVERKFISANPKDKTLHIQAVATRATQKGGKKGDMPWPGDNNPDVEPTEEDMDGETGGTDDPEEQVEMQEQSGAPVLTKTQTRRRRRQ